MVLGLGDRAGGGRGGGRNDMFSTRSNILFCSILLLIVQSLNGRDTTLLIFHVV